MINEAIDPLRAEYERRGKPYGASQPAYERWCDEQLWELEDRFFGPDSRDPRRVRPADRGGAPASASAEIRPQ